MPYAGPILPKRVLQAASTSWVVNITVYKVVGVGEFALANMLLWRCSQEKELDGDDTLRYSDEDIVGLRLFDTGGIKKHIFSGGLRCHMSV